MELRELILRARAEGVDAAQRKYAHLTKTVGSGLENLRMKTVALSGAFVGLFSAFAAKEAFSGLLETNRTMESLFLALKTATGGIEQANLEWGRLKKFAAETPFALSQSVEAFIKLKNLGLDPSEEAMRSFGDTASAMNKDMMQFIEAVADAVTGENERLKEFGIKASISGDKVTYTFRNQATTIKNSAEEIQKFLIEFGKTNFAGAMEDQMSGLNGKLSNLSDTFDNLKTEIGKGGFTDAVGQASDKLSDFLAQMIDSEAPRQFGQIVGGAIGSATEATIKLADVFAPKFVKAVDYASGRIEEFAKNKNKIDEMVMSVNTLASAVASLGNAFVTAGSSIGGYLGELKAAYDALVSDVDLPTKAKMLAAATEKFIQPTKDNVIFEQEKLFGVGKNIPANVLAIPGLIGVENVVKNIANGRSGEITQSSAASIAGQLSGIPGGVINRVVSEVRERFFGDNGSYSARKPVLAPTASEVEEIKRTMRKDVRLINEFEEYYNGRFVGSANKHGEISTIDEYFSEIQSRPQRINHPSASPAQAPAKTIEGIEKVSKAAKESSRALEIYDAYIDEIYEQKEDVSYRSRLLSVAEGDRKAVELQQDLVQDWNRTYKQVEKIFDTPGMTQEQKENLTSAINEYFEMRYDLYEKQLQEEKDRIEKDRLEQSAREFESYWSGMESEAQNIRYQFDPKSVYKDSTAKIGELSQAGLLDPMVEARAVQEAMRQMEEADRAYWLQHGTWIDGAKIALADYRDEITKTSQHVYDAFSRSLQATEDLFVQFAQTGKFSFSSLVQSIQADMVRIAYRNTIGNLLTSAFSSLFAGFGQTPAEQLRGQVWGGARAMGGPVYAGSTYLVGERGPELFSPKQSGTILPKEKTESVLRSLLEFDGARAMGGPVYEGGTYLVGERGPEMFVSRNTTPSNSSTSTNSITIQQYFSGSPSKQTAKQAAREAADFVGRKLSKL